MPIFAYPTKVERMTSGFRPPERKDHHGIDLALPGTHEIFAVADGVVSRSYLSTSYGECVMIVHELDGQVWETVYAHMRTGSRTVKEGQEVKQGQVLGIMGNTGDSSGQHLHFELHRGRWNKDKTNAVNPLDYLSKPSEEQPIPKEEEVPDISPWAVSSVEWAKEKGVMSGFSDGSFRGSEPLTREQAAAAFKKFYSFISRG